MLQKSCTLTCFGMLSGQHVVGKGSRIGQTLQGRVQETCVAQVMETCSNAVALVPFQTKPFWGKQDFLRQSNAIPTGHDHCMVQKRKTDIYYTNNTIFKLKIKDVL